MSSVNTINDITDGSLAKAYIFGQTNQPVAVKDVEFINFKASKSLTLESSNGRKSPIVSGALFVPPAHVSDDQALKIISSTAAWAPRLPKDEELLLRLNDLTPDGIYEIKLVFSGSGRLTTSKQIKLSPSGFVVDMQDLEFVCVAGNFIANKSQIEIRIGSNDDAPPFINALIIKNTGHAPRIKTTFFSSP